jgi:hypothetical protein
MLDLEFWEKSGEERGARLRISLPSNWHFRLWGPACLGISQGSFIFSLSFHCRTSPTGCKEGFSLADVPVQVFGHSESTRPMGTPTKTEAGFVVTP